MYKRMFKCTHSSSLLEIILAHMIACATSREVWVVHQSCGHIGYY